MNCKHGAAGLKHLSASLDIKALADDGAFTGYGSVFGIEDRVGDVVEKGAFTGTLATWGQKNKLPPMLWQHRMDEPIGVYTKMLEDEHGLYVEGRLLVSDDPLAKRAYAHMKAGSVTGLSIGYTVPRGGGVWDDNAGVYRLSQIQLWEVSLVTFPANESAQVETVKSALRNPTEFERFLRDAGLSRAQAKALMGGGWKAISGARDAMADDDMHDDLQSLIQTLRG